MTIIQERDREQRLLNALGPEQPVSHNRMWRAVMLAPTLEVCEALLRGERVPRTALDPIWIKRFGK